MSYNSVHNIPSFRREIELWDGGWVTFLEVIHHLGDEIPVESIYSGTNWGYFGLESSVLIRLLTTIDMERTWMIEIIKSTGDSDTVFLREFFVKVMEVE
jgi:hypothetical protein